MKKAIAYDSYQEIADFYAEKVPTKDYNAYYDRPAILSLLDEVAGKSILDAGCGTGIYTEILLNRSAIVTGIDVSDRMLHHAMQRNGVKARFILANMEEPLTSLVDDEFDGILSALAISYVKDLNRLFNDFARILKPNGWFIFSTEHPFHSHGYFKISNYFENQPVSCVWHGFDKKINMCSYYHSLGYICEALSSNGFSINRLLEAKPTKEFQEQDPEGYEKRMKFPAFIHFKARKTD